ncbi:hypothetical protein PK69_09325 [Xanthomonas phaseoli pv. phaseoli]|uniref:Uncharacterized protein n=1 Tax=Xanthomonas campestris pv. phaseoli TaxID=317013 RepID=A0AB34QMK5_XANCH|nr:hypothetical protein AC609_19895 [Xanthomonas phaseoli pv. phaseoli]AZU32556.1 hypothetical protein AC801_23220 [Xanthomonas sp. ISO98C4]KUF21262.1 hypothetical protein AO826_14730 [Xanthomonas phaseoli pv. manihotis]AZU27660.1 hypothetical protein AC611_19915 [Xanthomonas phaseoli pv. phaseoli]AZU36425.1 hypothetical protein AC610_19885 [Xanthomonas phaseoli pv. phaseoli]
MVAENGERAPVARGGRCSTWCQATGLRNCCESAAPM